MSKKLKRLLGNTDPLFLNYMHRLEQASGQSAVDVRLLADITHAAHEVMRTLRLDTADTTAKELYMALNASVRSGFADRLLEQTDYVLLEVDSELISFSLLDVIENTHHELDFADRTVAHARRSLRGEIVERYASHERTDTDATIELAKEAGLLKEEDRIMNTEVTENNAPKILAVGDIFTDAFIKLNESYARIIKDEDGTEWLGLPFGQKPPYESVDIVKAVGPSPNAAVSFARLGLDAELLSWLGDDKPGQESYEYLQSQNVRTDSLVTEEGKASSYWYVLRYGADRTMLVKSELYSYKWIEPKETPEWIYLSYTGKDSWPLHEELMDYLEQHPDIKLVFQPGTYQFEWGPEKLARVYGRSHMVVMNREEAVSVTGASYDSISGLMNAFHDMGAPLVVITDGPKGSYAGYDGKVVTIPNYPDPKAPYDRTGAGDAFASTIVAALAHGETMETALTWAPINSMNVVQHIGAQTGLLTRDEIQTHLDNAPEWYKVTELQEDN